MKERVAGTTDERNLAEEDDAALVARVVAGEIRLYGRLVERHQRGLYWSVIRMVGDADEAEDIVQEAFVRAYRRLADYDPAYRFSTWLYTIARNRARNELRRRKVWGFLSLSREESPTLRSTEEASESAEANELGQALGECRRRLPDDQRETFDLRHADGLSYAEIAAVTGVPQGTVMSRLSRARRKMRECLESKGVTWT